MPRISKQQFPAGAVGSDCGNQREVPDMISIRWSVIALLILLVASATPALAQGTGDLVGRVTDTSGGGLPAVTVTATNVATKNTRTTISSDTGDYTFTLLPIG